MTKYILTETETFDPSYNHQESFDTLADAQSRMNTLYHELAVEGDNSAIVKAELNERSAMVEINDGNVIEWDIAEC